LSILPGVNNSKLSLPCGTVVVVLELLYDDFLGTQLNPKD
jgi:hypothetical protein